MSASGENGRRGYPLAIPQFGLLFYSLTAYSGQFPMWHSVLTAKPKVHFGQMHEIH